MKKKLTPRTVALSLEYHLFKKDKGLLRAFVPPKVQGMLRRRARAKYLIWDARPYNEWMTRHLELRKIRYAAELEAGLLSIATPVWDGTPVSYLRLLAESIAGQNGPGACEWLVLDNGCQKPAVRRYLGELSEQYPWVHVHRVPENLGIVGGMRACLEQASGRYLCTVDSDDLLYPDALQIVQWWIKRSGYAPLLYSDEDKIIGTHKVQPYFKPDFDPVLLLNSAYIAHLGVVQRETALKLGAYTDRNAEGSPDWDCFVRFYCAGYEAIHIPEVIYSWRMHPESTADDAGSKPYIHNSQRAVLGGYLELKGLADYVVQYSPLLPGTADWWLERQHVNPLGALLASEQENVPLDYPDVARIPLRRDDTFADFVRNLAGEPEMICLLQEGWKPERDDFLWEAQGLFERFPDAGMVGGWLASANGSVVDGPLVLGFEGGCGCPDEGRPVVDPGYFTQMRKQRSVSAISSRFAVLRTTFLLEAFESGGFQDVRVADLGPWLGHFALRRKERILFSPFLRCAAAGGGAPGAASPLRVADPDNRYYPLKFGLTRATAYHLVRED
jgi:glycosyltransferase involved in cell wall biosynthesis